jgi:hypothetical protein
MKNLILYILFVIFIICLPSLCFSAQIFLKDGTIIIGKIIEQSESLIKVETQFGLIKLKTDSVSKIIFNDVQRKKIQYSQKWNSVGVLIGLNNFSSVGLHESYGRICYCGILHTIVLDKRTLFETSVKYTNKKSKIITNTKLNIIPISAKYKHILFKYQDLYPYLFIGTSYNWVWITSKKPFLISNSTDNIKKYSQNDRGFGVNSGIGTYLFLQSFSIYGEIEYSYSFLGNSKIGRLGNIGGLNFIIAITYNF